MYQDKKKIVLGFLIFPGFPMSCLTSAIEPLRAANEIAGAEVLVLSDKLDVPLVGT
jgi:transcriptional regulator GlxA family with amidase domain